jgi:hypothetical protein
VRNIAVRAEGSMSVIASIVRQLRQFKALSAGAALKCANRLVMRLHAVRIASTLSETGKPFRNRFWMEFWRNVCGTVVVASCRRVSAVSVEAGKPTNLILEQTTMRYRRGSTLQNHQEVE